MTTHYDYVLVGGGVASVWAAQNIRETDKTGKIALIGAEAHPPYDRPPLSKGMIKNDAVTPDDAYSKYDDFYPKNDIDLHKSTRVIALDPQARTVTLDNGETFAYGKLLLATGSRARLLDVPGAHRPNVHPLRTIEDSLAIREAAKQSQRVVLIGSGYIGMEVAADLRDRGLEVTIVSPDKTPWAKFASEKFGTFLRGYYEAKGVQFVLGDVVASIEGEDAGGPAHTVVTKSGQRLAADFVVTGVGAELNTELATEAGLATGADGGVRVNEFLQTSDPNIWAAGDIALFKDIALGKEWRAEHHLHAKWQGQAAGKILAGGKEPYDRIPYFFSDEFDIHMVLRGDPQGGEQSLFVGDVDGAEFAELYIDAEGVLMKAIAISHDEPKLDGISDTLEALIRARVNLKGREAEIQAPGFDLNSLA